MSENTPTPTPLWQGSLRGLDDLHDWPWPEDTEVALVTAERLRVLEVIRQRVSDGWTARLNVRREAGKWKPRPEWWPTLPEHDVPEPMEPEVAGVLWPDEETQ